jgi:hypothetical protein
MATTSRSFDLALAKGEYGEQIVRRILERKGFVVYKPATEGAHAFDVMAIKDKSRCIAMDVKAKSRRNKYADTGINIKHFQTYKSFSDTHSMPFWVVFVDEMIGKIYGNTLEQLSKPVEREGIKYPYTFDDPYGGTIYWHLDSMLQIYTLSESDKSNLVLLSQRNHEYKITP